MIRKRIVPKLKKNLSYPDIPTSPSHHSFRLSLSISSPTHVFFTGGIRTEEIILLHRSHTIAYHIKNMHFFTKLAIYFQRWKYHIVLFYILFFYTFSLSSLRKPFESDRVVFFCRETQLFHGIFYALAYFSTK